MIPFSVFFFIRVLFFFFHPRQKKKKKKKKRKMSVWSGAARRVVSSITVPSTLTLGYPQPRKTQKCLPSRRFYSQPASSLVLSPSVLRLITEHSINPTDLFGTGPQLHLKGAAKQGPLILKSDVLDFIANGKQAPQPTIPTPAAQPIYTPPPLNSSSPKPVPHVYMSSSVKVDGLISFENTLPSPLSTTDVIAYAMVAAVKANPSVNSVLNNDGSRQSRGVSLKVSWVGEGGMMESCVLPNAEEMGLGGLEEGRKAGGGEGALSSISLSVATAPSLVSYSNIIQDPHHSCTIVVGPFLKTLSLSAEGKPETVRVADINLSYDARIVQDQEAASFLKTFCRYLKNPYTLL